MAVDSGCACQIHASKPSRFVAVVVMTCLDSPGFRKWLSLLCWSNILVRRRDTIARIYPDFRLDVILLWIEYDRMLDTMDNVKVPDNRSYKLYLFVVAEVVPEGPNLIGCRRRLDMTMWRKREADSTGLLVPRYDGSFIIVVIHFLRISCK